MGLADFIEQSKTGEVFSPQSTNPRNLHLTKNNTREEFSFLRPCPICQGRHFTYREKGGFFCSTCQPGITGTPAYAASKEQPSLTHTTKATKITSTNSEEACFKIGFPWIMEHLEELLSTGWTRAELFRRSRHRWCIGKWGLAWAPTWIRPGVIAAIEKKGRVSFTFKSGGRTITQAAYHVHKAWIKVNPAFNIERCKKAENNDIPFFR